MFPFPPPLLLLLVLLLLLLLLVCKPNQTKPGTELKRALKRVKAVDGDCARVTALLEKAKLKEADLMAKMQEVAAEAADALEAKERELEELLEKADVARESEGRMKKQVRMVTVTAAVCISVVRLRLRLRLFVYLSAMARSP